MNMDSKTQFRQNFLLKCAEHGLSAKEAGNIAEQLLKQAANTWIDSISSLPGKAIDLLVKTPMWGGALAGIGAGATAAGLQRGTPTAEELAEIKSRELLHAYRRASKHLRHSQEARKKRDANASSYSARSLL